MPRWHDTVLRFQMLSRDMLGPLLDELVVGRGGGSGIEETWSEHGRSKRKPKKWSLRLGMKPPRFLPVVLSYLSRQPGVRRRRGGHKESGQTRSGTCFRDGLQSTIRWFRGDGEAYVTVSKDSRVKSSFELAPDHSKQARVVGDG